MEMSVMKKMGNSPIESSIQKPVTESSCYRVQFAPSGGFGQYILVIRKQQGKGRALSFVVLATSIVG